MKKLTFLLLLALMPLMVGAQNSSSNSTLAQKTTNSIPTQKATTSSATAQKRYHDVEFHNAKGKVKSIKTNFEFFGQPQSNMVEFTIDGKEKGATDVEYDNNGYRLSSKDIFQDGSTLTMKYTWKNDRVIKVFNSYKNISKTLNITYNAKGELIEESDPDDDINKIQYSDYKYDARGNWISRKSSIIDMSTTETRTIVYY